MVWTVGSSGTNARLLGVVAALGEAIWECDLATGEIVVSPEGLRALGLDARAFDGGYRFFEGRVHPDDHARVSATVAGARDATHPVELEVRLRHERGHWVRWRVRCRVTRDRGGAPTAISGTAVELAEPAGAEGAREPASRRFREMVERSSDWIWQTDRELSVSYASPAARELLGREPGAIVGASLLDLVPSDDRPSLAATFAAAHAAGRPIERLASRRVRADGTVATVETNATPVTDANGTVTGWYGIDRDVTPRNHADAEYRAIVRAAPDAFWLLDPTTARILEANDAACGLLGRSRSELIGLRIADVDATQDESEIRAHIASVLKRGHDRFVTTWRHGDGHLVDVEVSASFADFGGGRVFAFARDVSARKLDEERIRELAFVDELTGLPNRRLLDERLAQKIAHARRYAMRFALLFVDLDHFKEVNDRRGHDVGDMLLRSVAGELGRCVRESDTVARWGGDEFVVLVDHVETEFDLATVAQKIVDTVGRAFALGGERERITPSVGVVVFPDDGEDARTLLARADGAMYEAKAAGRACFRRSTAPAAP